MTSRVESFRLAVIRLREAVELPETDVSRDAAIQRFEFCFELAWKVIQEKARAEGLDCRSPKGCLKHAFKAELIHDESGWLDMLEDRNRTTHTYDEALARDVFGRLPRYVALLEALVAEIAGAEEKPQ